MMCVMHQADPYGYLVLNGNPIEPSQLARMVGASEKEVTRWMAELHSAGVDSKDEIGLFSRRMVRDEYLRNVRGSGGVLGGNPALVGTKVNGKVHAKVNHPPTIDPTPSSSSSSSSSTSKELKTKVPRHPVEQEKVIEIPDWLPMEQWTAYLQMRTRIRKPATAYAQNMAIAKLSELRDQGQHPAAVLGQSIMNSWQSIYPLKNGVAS